jgi:hypothetical protein
MLMSSCASKLGSTKPLQSSCRVPQHLSLLLLQYQALVWCLDGVLCVSKRGPCKV